MSRLRMTSWCWWYERAAGVIYTMSSVRVIVALINMTIDLQEDAVRSWTRDCSTPQALKLQLEEGFPSPPLLTPVGYLATALGLHQIS